jgi:hypothetical protein
MEPSTAAVIRDAPDSLLPGTVLAHQATVSNSMKLSGASSPDKLFSRLLPKFAAIRDTSPPLHLIMCGGARALIDPATDLAGGPDRTHYADPLAQRLKSLSRD